MQSNKQFEEISHWEDESGFSSFGGRSNCLVLLCCVINGFVLGSVANQRGFFSPTPFLPGLVSQAPFLTRGRDKSLMHCWPMFLHIEFNEIWNTSIIKTRAIILPGIRQTFSFSVEQIRKVNDGFQLSQLYIFLRVAQTKHCMRKLFALYPTLTSFHNFPSPSVLTTFSPIHPTLCSPFWKIMSFN